MDWSGRVQASLKLDTICFGYTTWLRVSDADREKRFVCHDIFIDGILYQTYNIHATLGPGNLSLIFSMRACHLNSFMTAAHYSQL